MVVRHLRLAAESHTILSQPDASQAADLFRRAKALADRIEGEPEYLGRIVVSGTLAQRQVTLWLDAAALAAALHVNTGALAPDLTTIAQSFALRRRGIETKIIAGETTRPLIRSCSARWPKRISGREPFVRASPSPTLPARRGIRSLTSVPASHWLFSHRGFRR
jgi:hypothetical protein